MFVMIAIHHHLHLLILRIYNEMSLSGLRFIAVISRQIYNIINAVTETQWSG